MIESAWIEDLLLVLATAGVVVPLFGRLKLGVVPGFLIAGLIVGPGGLGRLVESYPWLGPFTLSEPETVRPFAELGVLFLLFIIGLEFSVDRLWSMRRLVFGFGTGQVLLSALIILPVALWFTGTSRAALVVAFALALSSTAIVTQFLIERHRFATPVGRASLAVLLLQDLTVVPLVIVVGLLAGEDVAISGALLRAVLYGAGAVVAIVLAARFLVGPLMRLAANTGSRELLVAIALFIVIATSLATSAAGLSAALGAFLAGILLGGSEFRHQIEVDVEPFKGLLLGLFFMTVGMTLDAAVLLANPFALVAAVVALIAAKALVALAVALAFRLPVPVAVEAALLLAGAGEFAFVLFELAHRGGVVGDELHQFAVTAAALSMMAIPLAGSLGRFIGERIGARQAHHHHGVSEDLADMTGHVVIGGFGRVGQAVARMLQAERIPYVALDLEPDLISEQRLAGRNVFFGDASRHEILDRVGAHNALAFVVTTNKPEAAERMVAAIVERWPEAAVHARAQDAAHAERLAAAGAVDVVPEALEGSLTLAAHVLSGMGLDDEAVHMRITIYREEELSGIVRRAG